MNKFFASILICTVASVSLFAPLLSYAQTQTVGPNQALDDSGNVVNTQRTDNQATNNGAATSNTKNGAASSAATSGLSCAAGQILSKAIVSAVNSLAGTVTNKVTGNVSVAESGQVKANSDVTTAAHTGSGFSVFGVNVNFAPSWDAIAFCIGNALIQYIADSTIQWINSGFNGNPAFVSNPQQFFTDIADQEASNFIQGFVKGTLGVNVCQPFKVAIQTSLVNNYNSSYAQRGQCSLQQVSKNVQGFLSGDPGNFSLGSFYSASQNSSNNYIGAQMMANNELAIRVNTKVTLAEQMIQRNGGYQDVQNCPKDAKGNITGPCTTQVTGSDVQKAGQDNRNLANLRLVAAQKFDQVVSALVNELIKVSLNKILTSSQSKTSH